MKTTNLSAFAALAAAAKKNAATLEEYKGCLRDLQRSSNEMESFVRGVYPLLINMFRLKPEELKTPAAAKAMVEAMAVNF